MFSPSAAFHTSNHTITRDSSTSAACSLCGISSASASAIRDRSTRCSRRSWRSIRRRASRCSGPARNSRRTGACPDRDGRNMFERPLHWEFFYDVGGKALVRLHRVMGQLRRTHRALRSRGFSLLQRSRSSADERHCISARCARGWGESGGKRADRAQLLRCGRGSLVLFHHQACGSRRSTGCVHRCASPRTISGHRSSCLRTTAPFTRERDCPGRPGSHG